MPPKSRARSRSVSHDMALPVRAPGVEPACGISVHAFPSRSHSQMSSSPSPYIIKTPPRLGAEAMKCSERGLGLGASGSF